ncbi:hypothetical protein T552_00624 [Pneumocystis carinii B80]|uniref:ER membrane protein complex subunit 2 n=1 Tax=Pneumocystis carinii (strain B80) TaxID=1408658 RepID=A0A0W4ZP37_PNEC8|nr:hypothetical protein T552_00624 [Pneumocystis carinii B80]KTW30146.1 hypothetical protein T552_00624 [Pneumocystis carinii B80]
MHKNIEALRKLRMTNSSCPENVLKLSKPIIQLNNPNLFRDEIWEIYEQTFLAALEIGDDELANQCLTELLKKFPTSTSVIVLKGLYLEAIGNTSEALKCYNDILSTDESNIPILKRRIALLRSLGKTEEAVNELVKFLDIWYLDAEAWAELADIYFSFHLYKKALFCYWELLLLQPSSHLIHARCALVLYIQSFTKPDLLHAATKEYLRSIELCENFLQGFCGLKECCISLLKQPSSFWNTNKKISYEINVLKEKPLNIKKVKSLDEIASKMLRRFLHEGKPPINEKNVQKYVKSLIES